MRTLVRYNLRNGFDRHLLSVRKFNELLFRIIGETYLVVHRVELCGDISGYQSR